MNESADARYLRANRHLPALSEAAKALAKQNPSTDAFVALAEIATAVLNIRDLAPHRQEAAKMDISAHDDSICRGGHRASERTWQS